MVIAPASAWSSAFSVRNTVVLPDPDGPITAVTVPARHVEGDVPQHLQLAERLVHAAHRQQVGHRATYLSSRVSSRLCANDRTRQMTQ